MDASGAAWGHRTGRMPSPLDEGVHIPALLQDRRGEYVYHSADERLPSHRMHAGTRWRAFRACSQLDDIMLITQPLFQA